MSGRSAVTVLGAGVIGVACALYLQRDGWTVTVIDRQGPGEGASRGNAGIFATDNVHPLATPGVLLKAPRYLLDPLGPLAIRPRCLPRLAPWLTRFALAALPSQVAHSTAALRALVGRSREAWLPLLQASGLTSLMTERGWVAAFETVNALRREQTGLAEYRGRGGDFVELGGDEVRDLEPALSQTVVGGIWYRDAAHSMNSFRLVRDLAAHFRRLGGKFQTAEIDRIDRRDGAVDALVTTTGDHLAIERLVLATGAWSRRYAAMLGDRVPLDTERGYHLHFPEPGVGLSRPVMSGEYKFFITPMETGLRLAGTVELASLSAPPNWRRAEVLLERARRLLPGLNETPRERWMGHRPSIPDSLPVIGPASGAKNAWYAFGHQHLGLTLAAATGEVLADLMAGRAPALNPEPYRATRF